MTTQNGTGFVGADTGRKSSSNPDDADLLRVVAQRSSAGLRPTPVAGGGDQRLTLARACWKREQPRTSSATSSDRETTEQRRDEDEGHGLKTDWRKSAPPPGLTIAAPMSPLDQRACDDEDGMPSTR